MINHFTYVVLLYLLVAKILIIVDITKFICNFLSLLLNFANHVAIRLRFCIFVKQNLKMSKRKYKIVLCSPALYSAGGVERVVSVKANFYAEKLGCDVTIIVTEGLGRNSFFPLSDLVKVINYEIDFEKLWNLPFYKKIFVYLQKQHKYKKMLKADLLRIRPDFTISTLRREINFLTDIKDGSIKIGELHVNRDNYRSFDKQYSNFVKRVFSWFWVRNLLTHLERLDRMVVLTENAMNDWPELNNVVLIPDPLPFKINDKSQLLTKRIISIGRYSYDKGNDLLLKAWSIIAKRVPDWTLDIYGYGDVEQNQKLMMELGLNSRNCHLHGPSSDVKQEYLSSSIFVLPSRFEGFGLVIIEAMACGVPVVAFNCENGPRSIIEDGETGFLVSPFDINAFAEKVILLMNDQKLRTDMGCKAQKEALQYDIETIGLRWKRLFDELKGE